MAARTRSPRRQAIRYDVSGYSLSLRRASILKVGAGAEAARRRASATAASSSSSGSRATICASAYETIPNVSPKARATAAESG